MSFSSSSQDIRIEFESGQPFSTPPSKTVMVTGMTPASTSMKPLAMMMVIYTILESISKMDIAIIHQAGSAARPMHPVNLPRISA